MESASLTGWICFYIAVSVGMVFYFIHKYKNLRPLINYIDKSELEDFFKEDVCIIDVRSDKEWELHAWEPALHIVHDRMDLLAVSEAQKLLLTCTSGVRASDAAEALVKRGFTKVSYYKGYYKELVTFFENKSA